jgi:hypothetical protein
VDAARTSTSHARTARRGEPAVRTGYDSNIANNNNNHNISHNNNSNNNNNNNNNSSSSSSNNNNWGVSSRHA